MGNQINVFFVVVDMLIFFQLLFGWWCLMLVLLEEEGSQGAAVRGRHIADRSTQFFNPFFCDNFIQGKVGR